MRTILLASLLLCSSYSDALTGQDIADYSHSALSPGSGIYLPSDSNWNSETVQRWSKWKAPTFVVSLKPKLQEDVQKVIRYSSQNNISFLTTGGGHGYTETLSALNNGIQLDMGNFDNVSIDTRKNTLTIGGSVRFRDVTGPLYAAGKAIPTGACSCVGMTGATLAGGIGFYSGLYGAISDSLISVDLITGAGESITASDSENSDLFWGMRGAGFNFGAVTSLTYKVRDYPNDGRLMNADMLFPVSQNGSVWEVVQTFFGNNQPKELSLVTGLMFNADAQQVFMVVNVIYARPVEEGKELIKPFLALKPMNLNVSYLPWSDVSNAALYGGIVSNCINNPYYVSYSSNFTTGTVITLTQYAPWGFQQYSDNSSAFPHRQAVIFAQVDGVTERDTDVAALDSFGKQVRDILDKRGTYNTLPVYAHFAHGDEGPDSWYTEEKLPHLQELKKRYDSRALFSFYNPVR